MDNNQETFIFRIPLYLERLLKFFVLVVVVGSWVLFFFLFHKSDPLVVKVFLLVFAIFWTVFVTTDVFRNPWIFLKANRSGCFFRKFKPRIKLKVTDPMKDFIFVPWQNIGQVYVGLDEDRSKCICFDLLVNDDDWYALNPVQKNLPRMFGFLKSPMDSNGYRQFSLVNNFQDPSKVVNSILSIRKISK